MIQVKKAYTLKKVLAEKNKKKAATGFVPTMGALHPGHLSLIDQSKEENEITVCSIFVNPTQFNDPADFEKYPVTVEKDMYLLEQAGCDMVFIPSVDEIYTSGTSNLPVYDLGYLENIFEGKYRPGHFQGVCQVVHRLLDIVQPGKLYLGQKDFQQCMVIKKMLELTNLEKKPVIITCPTLREPDGLAMSSRNSRLTASERKKAVALSQAILYIKKNLRPGNEMKLLAEAKTHLDKNSFRTDYIEIADAATLLPVHQWDGKSSVVILAAAFMNAVRLIDNMLLEPT